MKVMNLFDIYSGLRNEDITTVSDEADNYLVEILAPGRSKEDFNIEVKKDTLVISTEVEYTKFNFTKFKKVFTLPRNVDAEKIVASYKAGVLIITIPKSEEEKRIIKIAIKEEN